MIKKILVVDDDPAFLSLIEEFLLAEGHEVVAVTTGDKAWQILIRDSSFNLVITDVLMPTMSGIDLVDKIIKLLPKTPEIIFISGSSTIDKKDAKNFGAKTILHKPINWDELIQAISN
jgi:two-component system alkaline phosphatase synthesis response regulator PhoP